MQPRMVIMKARWVFLGLLAANLITAAVLIPVIRSGGGAGAEAGLGVSEDMGRRIEALEQELSDRIAEIGSLRAELAEREAELDELVNLVERQARQIAELKTAVAQRPQVVKEPVYVVRVVKQPVYIDRPVYVYVDRPVPVYVPQPVPVCVPTQITSPAITPYPPTPRQVSGCIYPYRDP